MSKFPVELNDTEGIIDAVNYLLSGPGGLGQDVAGFSAYDESFDNSEPSYLTNNFRVPYSSLDPVPLYVAPISIGNAEQLDNRTIKYTFSSAQPSAPFSLGSGLTITGITPSTYNSASLRAAGYPIGVIGVIECTNTYVVVRARNAITTPLGTYVSGGSATVRSTEDGDNSGWSSTDCNGRVTVTGGNQRVLVSAQINQTLSYEAFSDPAELIVYVAIRRYAGFPNNDPVNPDFLFDFDGTVIRQIYSFPGLTGTGTLPELNTIFTTIVDQPGPGYYWYILEVLFEYPVGGNEIQVTSDELRARALTTQVIKQ